MAPRRNFARFILRLDKCFVVSFVYSHEDHDVNSNPGRLCHNHSTHLSQLILIFEKSLLKFKKESNLAPRDTSRLFQNADRLNFYLINIILILKSIQSDLAQNVLLTPLYLVHHWKRVPLITSLDPKPRSRTSLFKVPDRQDEPYTSCLLQGESNNSIYNCISATKIFKNHNCAVLIAEI